MAAINGKLIICDRCGETAFLKCVGEGEMDGGFTRWNKFEPTPDGWGNHRETGLLCPCCDLEYTKLVEMFKTKIESFKNKPKED
jgi:hypothetical protein